MPDLPDAQRIEKVAKAMWDRRNEDRRGWPEWGEPAFRDSQDAYRIMAAAALAAAPREDEGLRVEVVQVDGVRRGDVVWTGAEFAKVTESAAWAGCTTAAEAWRLRFSHGPAIYIARSVVLRRLAASPVASREGESGLTADELEVLEDAFWEHVGMFGTVPVSEESLRIRDKLQAARRRALAAPTPSRESE